MRCSPFLAVFMLAACSPWPDPLDDGVCLADGIEEADLWAAECIFGEVPLKCGRDSFALVCSDLPEGVAGRWQPNFGAALDCADVPPQERAVIVAHELGHGLGYEHGDALPCDVMSPGIVDLECFAQLCEQPETTP